MPSTFTHSCSSSVVAMVWFVVTCTLPIHFLGAMAVVPFAIVSFDVGQSYFIFNRNKQVYFYDNKINIECVRCKLGMEPIAILFENRTSRGLVSDG